MVRTAAWASLIANIGIILTGGLVRLTGSGLGCDTWPRCSSESLTPTGESSTHAFIEFGNRTLTFVLALLAVAAIVAALWDSARRRREGLPARPVLTRLALVPFLGGIAWLVGTVLGLGTLWVAARAPSGDRTVRVPESPSAEREAV